MLLASLGYAYALAGQRDKAETGNVAGAALIAATSLSVFTRVFNLFERFALAYVDGKHMPIA
jgi:hypothetical protein